MECMSDGCRERRGCFERLAMPCNAAGHASVMMRKYVGDLLGRVFSEGAGDGKLPERCW